MIEVAFRGKDLTGKSFGRLTVLRLAGFIRHEYKPCQRTAIWECQCVCGNRITAAANNLKNKNTESCGCLKREIAVARLLTHGQTGSHLYSVWRWMRDRCRNPKNKHWKHYGGRGIKVCDRWRDFAAFVEDMGPSFKKGLTIERICNDGNYEPGNCKWATRVEQQNNKRTNRHLTFRGETKTIAQWCRELNLDQTVIYRRIGLWGWPAEKALTTPWVKGVREP